MQGDEKMEGATVKEVHAAMSELERELAVARDEASKEASAQRSGNESFQFLLGVTIGFERALTILQGRMAVLRSAATTGAAAQSELESST